MLKQWQFDVLFFVGVGGAVVLLFGPLIGLGVTTNPLAAGGVGSILAFVLTQRKAIVQDEKKHDPKEGDPP